MKIMYEYMTTYNSNLNTVLAIIAKPFMKDKQLISISRFNLIIS